MFLSKIELQNFRNHRFFAADIPQKIYIYGDNGAGKTSLAESVYLLSTLKTFRQDDIVNLRTFNEKYMRIEGVFSGGNTENIVYFYQDKRVIRINGTEPEKLSDYIYTLPAICYSPNFESIFSQQHSDRRRFLDRMVFYTDQVHLHDLRRYNSLLARKRAELDKELPDAELLSAINEQTLPLSEAISERRQILVAAVNKKITENQERAAFFLPDMNLELHISSLSDRDEKKELECRRLLYGAHKDLLYLKQSGKTIEKFQSFGQKKAFLLFLLYYFAIYVEEYRKCDIMVILDDFEAGLDTRRCCFLNELFLSEVSENKQLIMTGLNKRQYAGVETLLLTIQ